MEFGISIPLPPPPAPPASPPTIATSQDRHARKAAARTPCHTPSPPAPAARLVPAPPVRAPALVFQACTILSVRALVDAGLVVALSATVPTSQFPATDSRVASCKTPVATLMLSRSRPRGLFLFDPHGPAHCGLPRHSSLIDTGAQVSLIDPSALALISGVNQNDPRRDRGRGVRTRARDTGGIADGGGRRQGATARRRRRDTRYRGLGRRVP